MSSYTIPKGGGAGLILLLYRFALSGNLKYETSPGDILPDT